MNGCRWRIGDGSKIKIMNEPWLKKEDGLWLRSPQDEGVFNMTVNQLMLQRRAGFCGKIGITGFGIRPRRAGNNWVTKR
jgi:hypothetical protein